MPESNTPMGELLAGEDADADADALMVTKDGFA